MPDAPAQPTNQGKSPLVLFVCTGNVCRSPMAEGLLRHHLPRDSRWRVMSAGLCAPFGENATHEAITAMAELGIDLTSHRSRPLMAGLVADAQVIVALTRNHRDEILSLFPAANQHAFLLRTFDPLADTSKDVADPIGGSLAVYRRCRGVIAAAIPGLVEFLGELCLPR